MVLDSQLAALQSVLDRAHGLTAGQKLVGAMGTVINTVVMVRACMHACMFACRCALRFPLAALTCSTLHWREALTCIQYHCLALSYRQQRLNPWFPSTTYVMCHSCNVLPFPLFACCAAQQNPAEKVADVAMDVLKAGADTLVAGAMIPARHIGKVFKKLGEVAADVKDRNKK